jgi:hypothetical protein
MVTLSTLLWSVGERLRRVGFTVGRCANFDGLCDGVAFGALLFGGSCVGDNVGNVTGLCVGNGVVGFFVGRTFFLLVPSFESFSALYPRHLVGN